MADYVSNGPISRPRPMGWKVSWSLGGMSWSHDWGMFYDTPSGDEQTLALRPPTPPSED
jgi:hypothetical protein